MLCNSANNAHITQVVVEWISTHQPCCKVKTRNQNSNLNWLTEWRTRTNTEKCYSLWGSPLFRFASGASHEGTQVRGVEKRRALAFFSRPFLSSPLLRTDRVWLSQYPPKWRALILAGYDFHHFERWLHRHSSVQEVHVCDCIKLLPLLQRQELTSSKLISLYLKKKWRSLFFSCLAPVWWWYF